MENSKQSKSTALQITELLKDQGFRFFQDGQQYTVYDVHEEFISYYRNGETDIKTYWHYGKNRIVYAEQMILMF